MVVLLKWIGVSAATESPRRVAPSRHRRAGPAGAEAVQGWPVRLYRWCGSTAGMALLGAVVLALGLPRADAITLWPAALVALIFWCALVARPALDGRRPYRTLYLAGLVFWLGALHWLRYPHPATYLGWLALSAYLAVYLPLFVGLSRVAVHRLRLPLAPATAVVWTGLEVARAYVLGGFTMASLGHWFYDWPLLIQISDLAGGYAVSFVVVFVAAAAVELPRLREGWRGAAPAAAAAVLLAAAFGYGLWRTSGDYLEPSGKRIALIQGSIDSVVEANPTLRKEVFAHYYPLAQEAVAEHGDLDLLVWPEIPFAVPVVEVEADAAPPPGFPISQSEFRQEWEEERTRSRAAIRDIVASLGTSSLLGLDTWRYTAQGRELYNSTLYVNAAGEPLGRYDKMHLVMFGEYIPLADRLPLLHRVSPVALNFLPGTRPAAFQLGELTLSPSICYEKVIPQVIRRQVNAARAAGRPVDVLVNQTNDGWFRGSVELDLHIICGVFRAVETRTPMLVAANTGFSAWIDGDGRIRQLGPRRDTAVLVAEPERDLRESLYLRLGDGPAALTLLACLFFAAVGCRARFEGRVKREG